jgi:tRNA dimethylallyltransferase
MPASPSALFIAGPTASGKSALALSLAKRHDGVIINADSMQVYAHLRVLTARPSLAEEAQAPHRLYGHVDEGENYSVARYIADAAAVLAETRGAGRLPIFVGGTGLYFKALLDGLSQIPPISAAARERIRAFCEGKPTSDLHAELARRDLDGAGLLRPSDRLRIMRALEVLEETGQPIRHFQASRTGGLLRADKAICVFLAPERDWLRARIDARFRAMMAEGALDEVRALIARGLDPLLPAMRAHGVPWLIRHVRGEMDAEAAIAGAQADTRRYAKRQFTWFRHQLPGFDWVAPDAALAHVEARVTGL